MPSQKHRASKVRILIAAGSIVCAAFLLAAPWPTVPGPAARFGATGMRERVQLAPIETTSRMDPDPAGAGEAPTAVTLDSERDRARTTAVRLVSLVRPKEEVETLWRAEQMLAARCMIERGYDYAPREYSSEDDEDFAYERTAPDDVDAARAVGYGIADAVANPASPIVTSTSEAKALTDEEPAPASDEFLEALLGPPRPPSRKELVDDRDWQRVEMPNGAVLSWFRNSCYAKARQSIYGEEIERNELGAAYPRLEDAVQTALASDDEYNRALGNWRDCMRDLGYEYTKPREAAEQLSQAYSEGLFDLETLRSRETRVAVADATCQRQSSFQSARSGARERAERLVEIREQAQIVALASAQEESLARAEQIVGWDSDLTGGIQ